MDNLKIYILTEGSSNIGFGHVTRCLSLYQAFEEKGIRPKLIINGDSSIIDLVKNTDFELANWLENSKDILNELNKADIVIIDSYLANESFYKNISKVVEIPVYIDDNKRIDYPRGIVINGNIHAESLNYPRRKGIIYLLGTKYIPLRKEFWNVPEKEIRKEIKSVMITFGGDDIRNMTPKVLKLLVENYPELEKNVIIGKGFRNVEEIKKVCDKNTNLIYYPDAEKMKQVMLDSDIAISAGGQTLYELARVGVPTITIAVADNQLKSVKEWEKVDFVEYAGWWEEYFTLKKIKTYFKKFLKRNIRLEKSIIGKKFVDGKGAKRIVDKIMYYYVLNLKGGIVWKY